MSLKVRTRSTFWTITTLQGGWWIWVTILVTRFHSTNPTYDWTSDGFGSAFGVFILLTLGFQLNYLFLYFIVQQLAQDEAEIVRYAAILRGTESAWQAISYGVGAIPIMAQVGSVYLNFGLWAVSILPAWYVTRHFGTSTGRNTIEDGDGALPAENQATDDISGK